MAVSPKINVIEEIKNRINNAMKPGGALECVKSFKIGGLESISKSADFPAIVLYLDDGQETADAPNRHYIDQIRLKIVCVCNASTSENNTLYDTEDKTGVLYLYDAILNAIDKNINGVPDNTLNGTVGNLRAYEYSIESSNELLRLIITISLNSIKFTLGSR